MGQQGETLTLHLRRNTTSEPWGFRLQGGLDFQTPLSVQSVNPAGVAERCGLLPSDAVLSLNGQSCEAMEHDDAKRIIIMAGLDVSVVIQRGAVNVWKPKVTPLSELRSGGGQQQPYGDPDGQQYAQRTSLAADKQESIKVGSAHNRSARPFPGFGGQSSAGSSAGVSNQPSPASQPAAANYSNQYNVTQGAGGHQGQGYGGPVGQGYPSQPSYSANASSQSSLPTSRPPHVSTSDVAIPGYRRVTPSFLPQSNHSSTASSAGSGAPPAGGPSGFRSVKAPVFDPNKVAPQLKNHPVCKACNQQIIGVFVKVCGEPLHAECFKCAACAKSLKNQGYYEHGGQLYCDSHGPSAQ